jgi:hypothetical protein
LLTLTYVAAWALFLLGWGTLLAAAFRVRIAKRYRFARYAMAALSLAYLWWQAELPDRDLFALILATTGLIIIGWVITLKR